MFLLDTNACIRILNGIMTPRPLLDVALLIALAFALACNDPKGCVQCGRDTCRTLAFTVHLENGGQVETCCPRCALRYIADAHPKVARLEARAVDTGRYIDARKAFWVVGSDVHPCASDVEGPPKDERGCCLKTVYDRCLPSALAFEDPVRAGAFAREHEGFPANFEVIEKGTR